jgi:hypothetical protein
MDVEALAKLLCRDFVLTVGRRHERQFVVTRFRYPDGDYVPLYVRQEGSRTVATDLGTTLFKCTVRRVAITDQRDAFIRSVCRRYGVEYEQGVLTTPITPESAGRNCLSLCEAITRVSNLQLESDTRDRSTLPAQIDRLFEQHVSPKRTVTRDWYHPDLDSNADYKVDYHLNGAGEARNVFFVGSSAKSTLVAAVNNFLKLHGAFAPTLTIVDPQVQLGKHYLNRLQRASTQIRFGLRGYEDDVVRFALGGMDGKSSTAASTPEPTLS